MATSHVNEAVSKIRREPFIREVRVLCKTRTCKMVQIASYVRRVLHKTRLIFSRINGPIVAEALLRMQMFPSLAARETCVAGKLILLLGNNKCFCHGLENIFASRTQSLRPKHMLPSLATPGNIKRNIVSATMFPSLAKP